MLALAVGQVFGLATFQSCDKIPEINKLKGAMLSGLVVLEVLAHDVRPMDNLSRSWQESTIEEA